MPPDEASCISSQCSVIALLFLDKPGTKQGRGVWTRSAINVSEQTKYMPSILASSSGRQPLSLFKLAAALGGGGLVRVRSIKFIQGMKRKFDKSNKCDPTLYQGAFIFQTDGKRCGEVPREATRERWRIGTEGDKAGSPHKARHYFSGPPLLSWETWLNANLQEHSSVKATVLSYSFIWITSGMRQWERSRISAGGETVYVHRPRLIIWQGKF